MRVPGQALTCALQMLKNNKTVLDSEGMTIEATWLSRVQSFSSDTPEMWEKWCKRRIGKKREPPYHQLRSINSESQGSSLTRFRVYARKMVQGSILSAYEQRGGRLQRQLPGLPPAFCQGRCWSGAWAAGSRMGSPARTAWPPSLPPHPPP